MQTVRIYRRIAKDVTLLDMVALERPRSYDETREDWDDGTLYQLPDGYDVARNAWGELAIYDPAGAHCEIELHSSGRPQLRTTDRRAPVLARA
ncbi:MAG TPA: hypothetical protein VGR63_15365 [Casimicrobiaceae bacterium]|jgi:hypothetical protein|nr:hypothetical protein [Casimicrobiaceae bacterium]